MEFRGMKTEFHGIKQWKVKSLSKGIPYSAEFQKVTSVNTLINSSYFLKYLHVVHKGGAGTGAAAWYGSGSSKMMLLWLRVGTLQLTLFINMLKVVELRSRRSMELNHFHFLRKLCFRESCCENFRFCENICVFSKPSSKNEIFSNDF
jgi:hypothetical protein